MMIPMLFNTEMADAIQNDRKTETRRVIKGPARDWPLEGLGEDAALVYTDRNGIEHEKEAPGLWATFEDTNGAIEFPMFKAPCKPGDVIWVRETWAPAEDGHDYLYRADANPAAGGFIRDKNGKLHVPRWRPSIHMPYEAARLFLKVKDVRVEHLQDITERGAFDEGFYKNWRDKTGDFASSARVAFSWFWDTTIKPADRKRYSWGANPWVWVISFKKITRREAEHLA